MEKLYQSSEKEGLNIPFITAKNRQNYSMEGLKEGLQIRNDKEVWNIIEISKNPADKIKEYRDTWLKSVTDKESGIEKARK